MNKLLVIGSLPPPIGGVTIHTSRLLLALKSDNFQFDYLKLSLTNLLLFSITVKKYRCVHIHSSNPFVRYYVMRICKIFGVFGIVTIHGDINRFSSIIKNYVDRKTIINAKKPIVLNKKSFLKTKQLNNDLEIVSSFIPPVVEHEYLDQSHVDNILKMKDKYRLLISTNASVLSYDKQNIEIYGIFELIEAMKSFSEFGLILSDPSGSYYRYFQDQKVKLPHNIYIINNNHSFYRVLELSDASVRNTITDGDSISIRESLFLNKLTFATDCVSRPNGCIIFQRGNFLKTITEFHFNDYHSNLNNVENGFLRLKEIYSQAY